MKQYIFKLYVWALPILVFAKGQVTTTDLNVGYSGDAPFLSASIDDGQLFFNIPETLLDKALLWTRIGSAGMYDTKHIAFRKEGRQIFMEEQRVWSETGVWIPIKDAPKLQKNILGIFPILEEDGEGYRIEVTSVLLGEEVVWEHTSSAGKVPGWTRVQKARNSGDEVMVKLSLGLTHDGAKWEQPVSYSFYRLPTPMEARPFDHRMGYWIEDKGNGRYPTQEIKGSIARWRLEKKDNGQEYSVPVKPIRFLISPDVPKKWRPYVRAGIEEWLPAFESAGFRDAIVVQEVDSLDEWSNQSLEYSLVRWYDGQLVRRTEKQGSGSTVSLVIDQRTGEIIKSDMLFNSPLERLMDEYFIRCAALDERAMTYPFPDALLGELIQFIIAHETGHALGIRDSHFGEYSYPVERMGDVTWLESMGHTPSIMTYARHNNLAQPEDGVPPSLLIQKVGPMDHYNILWGYQEFPDGTSALEKAALLEQLVRRQDSIPWYRYNSSQYEIMGPATTNEVVETNDPIKGMALGMKNLEQAMGFLPEICEEEPDGERMERIYGEALELWHNSMRHVLSLIGGYGIHYKSMDQEGNIFTPIDKQTQEKALTFLIQEVFDPPKWLSQPEFLDKISYSTYPDKVLAVQQLLLIEMLRPQRMKRFEQMEQIEGYQGMLKWYLNGLQEGLFKELKKSPGRAGRRKQELQVLYIEQVKKAISQQRQFFLADKKAMDHTDYTRGIMMGQLQLLQKEMEREVKRNKRLGSPGHWQLCLAKLESPMDF
ncbi:MAG: hypothetical protein CMH47_18905 [Muricauda sp.]|nr:zinc-dependent metalloprotease [uncultured Allomuricauda sp.]MBC74294.1 hypothetical protein [Allomuricauda sp.]|tara:strand:+ start:1356 stop:3653 length:2298 start_codon:yes stop_codon:yes gene_type:complete